MVNVQLVLVTAIVFLLLWVLRDFFVRVVLIACILGLVWRVGKASAQKTLKVHLIRVDEANEALLLEARLAGREALFQLDTGYAGPPVLSTTYLSLSKMKRASIAMHSVLNDRYKETLKHIQQVPGDEERAKAVDTFLRQSTCFAYTSGCTMRLMGIGSIVEQQAEMFLCDAIQFLNSDGRLVTPRESNARGDVIVTNPLPASVHILTCDYLMHMTPCCLSMRNSSRLNFRCRLHGTRLSRVGSRARLFR